MSLPAHDHGSFYALWIPDLFMRRVESGGDWSLFDPARCPGLNERWGDEYDALYEWYEADGLATRTVKAQDLWFEILKSQIETGTPYLLYKDAANAKSNQSNLGTIKCSNLCRCDPRQSALAVSPIRPVPALPTVPFPFRAAKSSSTPRRKNVRYATWQA